MTLRDDSASASMSATDLQTAPSAAPEAPSAAPAAVSAAPVPRASRPSAPETASTTPRRRIRVRVPFAVLGVASLAGQAYGLFGIESVPSSMGHLNADKDVHAVLFAVPVALFILAGVRRSVTVALALVLAVASEFIQGAFLPHRSGDPWDVVADAAGIALALLVTALPALFTQFSRWASGQSSRGGSSARAVLEPCTAR